MARDASESEECSEVLADQWTETRPETRPKAGGGLESFPADSVEEEEEEVESDLFRSAPSSAAEAGRESQGCGTGNGIWLFRFR